MLDMWPSWRAFALRAASGLEFRRAAKCRSNASPMLLEGFLGGVVMVFHRLASMPLLVLWQYLLGLTDTYKQNLHVAREEVSGCKHTRHNYNQTLTTEHIRAHARAQSCEFSCRGRCDATAALRRNTRNRFSSLTPRCNNMVQIKEHSDHLRHSANNRCVF